MSACDTLPMHQVPLLDRDGPWTEEEYLALGESHHRIELIDGSLWVSPGPNLPHQSISYLLTSALRRAARDADYRIAEAMNLRLRENQILIPDLVVGKLKRLAAFAEAAEVILVSEITSPSNALYDRGMKMQLYAAAKIPWYLLVEPDFTAYDSVALRLLRLTGDSYTEHAAATHGETLISELPLPMAISTDQLLDF
jgi:Uma2 family endonuclease